MLTRLKSLLVPGCLLLLAFVAAPRPAMATHFRYGQISWTTTKSPANTVQFQFYGAFRRSGYFGAASDGRPKIGDIISEDIGSTNLNFGDGASTPTLNFYVLNIDVTNDWLYGLALNPGSNDPTVPFIHSYPGTGPWTAFIDTCCRIDSLVNAPSGSYRVQTIVDLSKTTNSPTSTLPIIVNCPANQDCTFPVPATDSQNQLLTYRLATAAESYLGQPSGLTVDSTTGIASWPAPNSIGALYAAQIVVEKRDRNNPANLLTQIGVDFLINVVTMPTGHPPSFQAPTPSCGQQITVQQGQPISFKVSARSNNSGGTVALNVIGQPAGAIFSPALPAFGTPSVTSTFNFTPGVGQSGTYQLNFTATDNGAQTTCGYSLVVPAPNTVVSLVGIRGTGGNNVRFQVKIAKTECSTPIFKLYSQTGSGPLTLVSTSSVPLFQTSLTGPAGTVSKFYVVMSFATNCAPPAQSNTVTFTF